ncbi:uncharacterized protein LOC121414322 [Lytechinus variegatus]|uniref:uncharacterized protein LOC121414320 n=1 Tax=Lytechinus variegatus TaxID=7654 RepID=UPI001BB10C48|nr:uncharacterized protein LOC121414320 [Lytechinus variegatus]XP_041463395.1 uncharacterized protein LOC121414322 [Lytechinus variegatus]
MREPANNQQGGVKRFTYNGPNSSKDNSPGPTDDWFNGLPTKSRSDQSLHGSNPELDDVWSIRKNVSASLKLPAKQATISTNNPSTTGYYSRHGQYNKSSKLNEDTSVFAGSDRSGFGKSGGYSYGQSRSSYSYAGAADAGPVQSSSPRFTGGPSTTTQGSGRSGGIGPPLVSGNRSPTRSNTSRSLESQYSRGRGSDGWSSF